MSDAATKGRTPSEILYRRLERIYNRERNGFGSFEVKFTPAQLGLVLSALRGWFTHE